MSTRTRADVVGRIARLNPAPDRALTEEERARSEALLARVLTLSVDEGAAAQAAPAARTAGPARRSTGARRWRRGAAVAVAGMLGLGGVAYATGVTPESVAIGVKTLRAADAGTIDYSDAPAGDGAEVLARIAANAAASADLGDPDDIVTTHSFGTGDGWYGDDTQPGRMSTESWGWTMGAEWGRGRTVIRSWEGMNPEMPVPTADETLTEYRPAPVLAPNHEALSPAGKDIVLGPTPADTIRTLTPDEPRPSARLDYMVVDGYLNTWGSGIGILASNRSAFLEALATLDYTYYGPATDQLGRTGEAFGVEWQEGAISDEYRLLIDPSDGRLLASEDVLHGPWILGSRHHVTASGTYASIGTVPSVPACEDIAGCVVVVAEG